MPAGWCHAARRIEHKAVHHPIVELQRMLILSHTNACILRASLSITKEPALSLGSKALRRTWICPSSSSSLPSFSPASVRIRFELGRKRQRHDFLKVWAFHSDP